MLDKSLYLYMKYVLPMNISITIYGKINVLFSGNIEI